MIIKRIHIKNFGMITDMTLNFSNKLNIIEGQNEAGKSTIAAFIRYMLYGFDNTDTAGELSERDRRINWTSGTAEGSMHIIVKGKEYLITRSTVRTEVAARAAYKEEMSITDLETGSPAFGKVPAGEVFFGVGSELFDNTAFIGQLGETKINEGAVKESIENILFSGSEKINTERAASKLSVKLESLLHKSGSGGVIYDLMRRTDQLEMNFKSADEDNKLILAKEAKLHEIKMKRAEQHSRREKFEDLDMCYRNSQIIQKFDELHELEREYDEKNEEYVRYVSENTKAGFVPTNQYVTDIAVARKGVDDAYHNLVEATNVHYAERNAVGITNEIEGSIQLSDECGGEKTLLAEGNGIRKSQIKNIASLVGSSLLAVAAVVYEIAAKGALAGVFLRILFGLIGGVGVAAAAYSAYLFVKNKARLEVLVKKFSTETLAEFKEKIAVISEARTKRDGMIRSTENARLAVERARDAYEKAKADLLEVILRWGEEPPASGLGDFLDSLNERAVKFLEGEKERLVDKVGVEMKIRALRSELQGKSEIDIRALVSPLKRKVVSEVTEEEIKLGIEDCKREIEILDAVLSELESELSALKTRAIDPGELYSKMQANEARVNELKNLHKASFVALKAIESASDNLRLEISPRLAEYSTGLMEIMTNRKYNSIDVNDGMKVTFKDASGEEKSVDFLSGGTRDMTYVALRMALIDMLYTEKPPVCFDESFAHQDNVRARSMMKALACLAEEGYQSFIFTCRQREAALAAELSDKTEVFRLTASDAE